MDPHLKAVMDTYFRTFNEGDEAGNRALLAPTMVYFSSTVRTTIEGLTSFRGVWNAIREGVGIRRIEPLQWFGNAPELGALVSFQGQGGKPSVEAVMVFNLNPQCQITRIGVHWNPGTFLRAKEFPGEPVPSREHLADKDPRVHQAIQTYCQTFDSGDEGTHATLLSPQISLFGSLSAMESSGLASALGIYRSARTSLGLERVIVRRCFGDWPEVSVLMSMVRGDGKPGADALFVFQFEESALIRRLAILWNPLSFLKALNEG